MSLAWAPGLKPRWVREGRLAVSPMPRLGEEEKIVSMFNTVISLSPPSEHVLSAGYDPRSLPRLKPGIKVVWRPIGEYNAPTLVELIKILRGLQEPVLVHCFRGCGRSSVVAAAWLIVVEGFSLPEALVEVSNRTGCGLETAPQLSVVEAVDLARRAGLIDNLYTVFDVDDPVPEYVLLLARRLSPLAQRDPVEEARRAISEKTLLLEIAQKLSYRLDYKVAKIDARNNELVVLVWVPRRAHPSNVRETSEPLDDLERDLGELLSEWLGREIRVKIDVKPPSTVPWL